MFNKVVYALGIAALLYFAEELGKKKGRAEVYKELKKAVRADPSITVDQFIYEDHHADD